jgi:hypothetical protein
MLGIATFAATKLLYLFALSSACCQMGQQMTSRTPIQPQQCNLVEPSTQLKYQEEMPKRGFTPAYLHGNLAAKRSCAGNARVDLHWHFSHAPVVNRFAPACLFGLTAQ